MVCISRKRPRLEKSGGVGHPWFVGLRTDVGEAPRRLASLVPGFFLRGTNAKDVSSRLAIREESMTESPTPSAQEYEHLIAHFERLVRLTTIILSIIVTLVVGAGTLFFYKSVGDMKTDERTAVADVRSSAQSDIAKAKEDVLSAVQSEAKKRIDEEFNSSDITEMVEAAARRKVGRTIDRQIQDEVARSVSRIQDQIVETTEIANLGMEITCAWVPRFI